MCPAIVMGQSQDIYFLEKEYMFKGPEGNSRPFGKDEMCGGRTEREGERERTYVRVYVRMCMCMYARMRVEGLEETSLKDGRGR